MLGREITTTTPVRPIQSQARVEACGKVILIGEHAVVYGARAIAIPLKELNIQLSVHLEGHGIDMTIGGRRVSEQVSGVVSEAFELLGEAPRPCRVSGASSLPTGAGLGSSASLCIAVLRGVARALGRELSAEDLAKKANHLETRFHGTPSGIDATTVAFESVLCFKKDSIAEPIEWQGKKPLRFVLIDSTVRASTFAMVKISEPYFRDQNFGASRIEAFDQCVGLAMEGLAQGEIDKIAQAMNEVSGLLNDSGVVTALLMDMMERARSCGVKAVKPTGAGGGGYVLALLPEEEWQQVQQNLENCFGVSCVLQTWLSPH